MKRALEASVQNIKVGQMKVSKVRTECIKRLMVGLGERGEGVLEFGTVQRSWDIFLKNSRIYFA